MERALAFCTTSEPGFKVSFGGAEGLAWGFRLLVRFFGGLVGVRMCFAVYASPCAGLLGCNSGAFGLSGFRV